MFSFDSFSPVTESTPLSITLSRSCFSSPLGSWRRSAIRRSATFASTSWSASYLRFFETITFDSMLGRRLRWPASSSASTIAATNGCISFW